MQPRINFQFSAALPILVGLSMQGSYAQTYDPSGILDQNAVYEGNITIEASGNHGVSIGSGATNSTETVLKGDIHISVDRDKEFSTDYIPNQNNGINFNENSGSLISLETLEEGDQIKIDVYSFGGSGIRAEGSSSTTPVLIDGSKSSSPILITLHNATSSLPEGVDWVNEYVGAISTQGLGVKITGADVEIETSAACAYGLHLSLAPGYKNGMIEIERDLKITTYGDRASGIHAGYVFSSPGYEAVTVRGNTNIETNGNFAHGISSGGVNEFYGTATIKTAGEQSHASASFGDVTYYSDVNLETTGNGSIGLRNGIVTTIDDDEPFRTIVHGNATIKTAGDRSHGVEAFLLFYSGQDDPAATESLVEIRGNTTITTTGQASHGVYTMTKDARAVFGNTTINVDTSKGSNALHADYGKISANGVQKITGDIVAINGSIDLNMTGDSVLTGKSVFQQISGTHLRLSLSDSSNWVLTGDSGLSDLELNAGASLTLTIINLIDFTDITSTAIALNQGSTIYINVDGGFSISEGDEFKIFTSDSIADGGVSVTGGLGSGLIWDTSRLSSDGVIEAVRAPIPEPMSATLVLFGLAGSLIRRRR